MKFSVSAAASSLAVIACAHAYTVTGGSISSNKVELAKLNVGSDIPSIPIETTRDSFSVNVQFKQANQPTQLLFLLSGKKGLEYPVFARYVDSGSKASAIIEVSKLPDALKVQDLIHVSVVAASTSEKEVNVNVPLFSFIPSEDFRSSVNYEQPFRLGAKAEIYHQFKGDQPQVGSSLPIIFSAGVIGLLLYLFGTWTTLSNGNMFSGSQSSFWKLGYLATLGYFEFIVLRYYSGTSIFATLGQCAIVAAPLFFFRSRALTSLARLRR